MLLQNLVRTFSCKKDIYYHIRKNFKFGDFSEKQTLTFFQDIEKNMIHMKFLEKVEKTSNLKIEYFVPYLAIGKGNENLNLKESTISISQSEPAFCFPCPAFVSGVITTRIIGDILTDDFCSYKRTGKVYENGKLTGFFNVSINDNVLIEACNVTTDGFNYSKYDPRLNMSYLFIESMSLDG